MTIKSEEIRRIVDLIDELNRRILVLEEKMNEYDFQSLTERIDYIEDFLSRRSRKFYKMK